MKHLINSLRSLLLPRSPLQCRMAVFANVAVGTHPGRITRTLAATVSERYTLVKNGQQPGTVVPVADASEQPLGIATDTGNAGDAVNINLLGHGAQTQLMVAATAIAEGDQLYIAAGGRVQKEPGTPGMFYEVGTALTAASAAGQLVEVAATAPVRTVHIPPFEGNDSADLAKLSDALLKRPDKLRLLIS